MKDILENIATGIVVLVIGIILSVPTVFCFLKIGETHNPIWIVPLVIWLLVVSAIWVFMVD
jgi:hypothetical protein